MLRPEGGDPGIQYVCTLGAPAGGVPRAPGLKSSRVAGVPQCQTLCAGLMNRDLWFLSVRPARESRWSGVWAPCGGGGARRQS